MLDHTVVYGRRVYASSMNRSQGNKRISNNTKCRHHSLFPSLQMTRKQQRFLNILCKKCWIWEDLSLPQDYSRKKGKMQKSNNKNSVVRSQAHVGMNIVSCKSTFKYSHITWFFLVFPYEGIWVECFSKIFLAVGRRHFPPIFAFSSSFLPLHYIFLKNSDHPVADADGQQAQEENHQVPTKKFKNQI